MVELLWHFLSTIVWLFCETLLVLVTVRGRNKLAPHSSQFYFMVAEYEV